VPPLAPTPIGWRTTRIELEGAPAAVAGPGTGYPIETFTTLGAPLWGFRQIVPQGARGEVDTAAQLVEHALAEWRIPYRPDCDPDLVDVPATRRLRVAGRTLDILEAEVLPRRREIRLITREKVTGP
jgi:hypothetical protein